MLGLASVLIMAFVVPAWMPVLSNRQMSRGLWRAVIAISFSALLQLVFVGLLVKQVIALGNAIEFAAVGIPCCLLGMGFALNAREKSGGANGALLAGGLGLLIWLFLVTMR